MNYVHLVEDPAPACQACVLARPGISGITPAKSAYGSRFRPRHAVTESDPAGHQCFGLRSAKPSNATLFVNAAPSREIYR